MRIFKHLIVFSIVATVFFAAHARATSILASDTYNGHTYKLITADTWTNSEAFAQTLGGHLITVNDANENAWLTTQAFNSWGLSNSFWIGYSRNSSNPSEFIWADGSSSTYTNWAPGEPNNTNSYNSDAENYVHTYLFSSIFGQWNDLANVDPFQGPKFGVVELSQAPSAVPLPAAAWLFGSALMGFVGFTNRRRV